MRTRRCMAAVGIATLVFGGLGSTVARADTAQDHVVSQNPADFTPAITDGTVRGIAVVGDTVVVGGTFTAVKKGSTSYRREGILAFDRSTGRVDTDFAPQLDGDVNAVVAGPDGTVYVGGAFKHVNGHAQRGITRLSVANGARVSSFTTAINWGQVKTLARHGDQLYLGGFFTEVNATARIGLARVDAASGAVDPEVDLPIADERSGSLKVQKLAVSPDGSRLVIDGTFTRVAGAARNQIAMINTPADGDASVAKWSTDEYSAPCNIGSFDTYMRGIDFSPNGDYFVVVSTGGPYGDSTLCDAAARWETDPQDAGAKPTWANWTGGDSLYAVSVTGSAVYVGGHQRWLDNPKGHDSAGPGAVSRPGIGAIAPDTGKALPWNPTKDRGHGVEALNATATGLWVGSDTDSIGHEWHPRIAEFPLN